MSLDQLYLLPPAQQEAILNGPALEPPPGVTPNFDQPPNGNVPTLIVEGILISLSTIAVVLAVYTKLFFVKHIYLEDYLGFAGYAIYIAKTYSVLGVTTSVGLFVHQWDIRVRDLSTVQWYYHLGSEFYGVSILLLKVAIILEWMRIFIPRGTRNNFFWACHALLWTNVVFYVTVLIVGNVSCKPYAKLWDKTLPGNCRDNDTLDLATAPVGFVSDVLILLLPHRIIWRLHMSTRKKIGIALIFAIGIIACAASAYRIYASAHYVEIADRTYEVGGVSIGTDAELVCAVLVFCVPILPKAFKDTKSPFNFLGPLFSRLGRYTSKYGTGSSRQTQEKDLLSRQDSLQLPTHHNDYPHHTVPNSYGHAESYYYVAVPDQVHFPQQAIMRTTQIQIDEERGCDIPGPTSSYFHSARHCSQLNSSGALDTYDPYPSNKREEMLTSYNNVARAM